MRGSGERVVDNSTFSGFVFEIPTLSVDVILKAEGSATEMLVFCFEKKISSNKYVIFKT